MGGRGPVAELGPWDCWPPGSPRPGPGQVGSIWSDSCGCPAVVPSLLMVAVAALVGSPWVMLQNRSPRRRF